MNEQGTGTPSASAVFGIRRPRSRAVAVPSPSGDCQAPVLAGLADRVTSRLRRAQQQSRDRHRLLPVLLVLALTLNLGGCLKRISGTYRDSSNVVSLDFHRDGKVYAKLFGVPMVGDYEEKDNKIIFKGAEGDMFIDIIDADTLSMSHPLSSFTGEIKLKRQK